jgi:Immunity protein 8
MRAVVRSVRFPDLEQGAQFDPANVRELVEVCAGPSDGPGEEYFCLTVCTPAALAEVLEDQPLLVGRHWLFVAEFDAKAVELFLRRAVERIEGPTWAEVAAKIGRLGLWEFEDYRP